MKALQAQPNPAHLAIAALAERVPQFTLITQNVDDLHERAGSCEVIHLHGSLHTPRCFACGHPHPAMGAPEEPSEGRRLQPPRCQRCNGMVRPGVVWFGEALPEAALRAAFDAAGKCDLLLSIGTSGVVQPAASIPQLALRAGAMVVHVNPHPVEHDGYREFSLTGAAGEVLPELLQRLDSSNA